MALTVGQFVVILQALDQSAFITVADYDGGMPVIKQHENIIVIESASSDSTIA